MDKILKSGHSNKSYLALLGQVYYEVTFESRMWTTPFSIIFLRSASFYSLLFFNIDLIKSVHLGGKGFTSFGGSHCRFITQLLMSCGISFCPFLCYSVVFFSVMNILRCNTTNQRIG